MKSKSCKDQIIPLKKEKVCKPLHQFRGRSLSGFTLIEILVSVTIIATIVSMVYGSYFATAKSADVYKIRMTQSGRTRRVLDQMTRQIRCSYIGKVIEDEDLAGNDSNITDRIRQSPIMYFDYDYAPKSFIEDYIRNFMDSRRDYHPPYQTVSITLNVAGSIFGEAVVDKRVGRPIAPAPHPSAAANR